MAYGLIRYDVEDYLTPESNEALGAIGDAMERIGIPGSYALVGKKALFLKERNEQKAIDFLARQEALGFHSTSHSEHPTIAEELAQLSWRESQMAFLRRERPGVEMVSRVVKPPLFFTQPGGNWVPEAFSTISELGMDTFFSDAWNTYIKPMAAPIWVGDIFYLAPPVMTPRPFLLAMPGKLRASLEVLEQVPTEVGHDGTFMVMAHPTELATTSFWDAVNFGHGQTAAVWKPGPTRSASERQGAYQAFAEYLGEASRNPHIEWLTVNELKRRVAPLGAAQIDRKSFIKQVTAQSIGPIILNGHSFSAAQILWTLAYFVRYPSATEVLIPPTVHAPESWEPEGQGQWIPLGENFWGHGAQEILDHVRQTSALPSRIWAQSENVSLETFYRAAASHLSGIRPTALLYNDFLNWVLPTESLHWDWPIFPKDFRPMRLWHDTRRLAWTFKPIIWK